MPTQSRRFFCVVSNMFDVLSVKEGNPVWRCPMPKFKPLLSILCYQVLPLVVLHRRDIDKIT